MPALRPRLPFLPFAFSRTVLALAGAATCWLHAAAGAETPRLLLTFDDGPSLQTTPVLTPAARNQALLDTLARHGAHAVLFVTLGFGADRPQGQLLARAWGDAGHALGNHTVSHPDLDNPRVTLAQYQAEILRCDAGIRALPGFRPWFRYTFLHEGLEADKRDGVRRFLAGQGYRVAQVDLDSRDWAIEPQLSALLGRETPESKVAVARLKQEYLDGLQQQGLQLLAQAQAQPGPRVLLMHHNIVSTLWLDDALALLHAQGWLWAEPDTVWPAAAATAAAGGTHLGQPQAGIRSLHLK